MTGLVILGKHQEVRKQKRERLWYSISPSLVRALRVKPAEHQPPIDSNKSHYLSLAGLPSAGARMAGCLRFPWQRCFVLAGKVHREDRINIAANDRNNLSPEPRISQQALAFWSQ